MRGAGSTYNDIADRDLDAQVERTRLRPLPSGQVRPRHAALFLVIQALIGLAVLLQFNAEAVVIGLCSLLPVAIYPFMKRVMPMPQAILGLAFAWGALMGWAAVFARLDPPALLLYAGALCWVIGYDTIYAVQDIEDDEIAGIRSSARLFGRHVRLAVGLCYALAALFVVLAARGAGAGPVGYSGDRRLRRASRLAGPVAARARRARGSDAVPVEPGCGPDPVRRPHRRRAAAQPGLGAGGALRCGR